MKKIQGFLAVLAFGMLMAAGIGKTWAYFTTYAQAWGGKVVELGDETEITEHFSVETKRIRITNEEASQPVYLRVKVFAGKGYTQTGQMIDYTPEGSGEGWTAKQEDEFYYYIHPVDGGASTEELLLKIPFSEEPEADRPVNVIVVYESTPVRYDADGEPIGYEKTDWSEILDSEEITAPVTPVEGGEEG